MKLPLAAVFPFALLTGMSLYGCDEPRRTLSAADADVADDAPDDAPDAAPALDVAASPPDVPADDAPPPRDASAVDAADAPTLGDVFDAGAGALDVSDASAPGDARDAPALVDVSDATADATAAGARGTPTVDGVIGDDWPSGSLVAENTTPSPWGPSLNALRALRVAWDDANLYVGVAGVVEPVNALVLFLDRDVAATPTGLRAPSALTDGVGALDDALSCAIDTTPAGFGAELAWGTVGMQRKAATELRPEVGLRDVACPGCAADLGWIAGDTAVCLGGGAPACEVAIPWTAIYGPSGRPPRPALALFARITNRDGRTVAPEVSLPRDASPSARAVSVAAVVTPAP
jgi:hypothetical protein